MKKLKISLSIVAICLSIAVFCFGVFAATQVTYSIGGTVSYTVTDALVEIKTRVYSSQERATSDTKLLAMANNLTYSEYVSSGVTNGTLTEITKYSDGRLDVNTLQDQREPAIYPDQTADTKINIDYSNSNYTWYIVVSITNIADNIVWANVSKQSFTGDFNSYSNYTAGIDSIAKDETKTIVIGFSVKDEKISIKDSTFDYSITISADQSAKPELDTNPRIESVGKYYTKSKVLVPLSQTAYSMELPIKHDGDEKVSDSTTFGSIVNFNVPANTSSFNFQFDLIVTLGSDSMKLSSINESDFSNWFKDIRLLNSNVSDFSKVYNTTEYNNANVCTFSLKTIDESNKIFECNVTNATTTEISIVITYGPMLPLLYQIYESENMYINSFELQIQTDTQMNMVEIGHLTESSIPMQNFVDGEDTMYYFSYITNVPTNAQQLKLSLSTPLQVTDSTDATKKVNVLTLIEPIPLKGNYPTYESVVSAMGSDESWTDKNMLNPTTFNQSEQDGTITGEFPCGGVSCASFFVVFGLSAEQIKELQDQGYDITKAFNCNLEITYMGISEDADTVKLNTIEKTEHISTKKAYLEGETGEFYFDSSSGKYYQNFYVKNVFDKYDKMYLYITGPLANVTILSGERSSISGDLDGVIAKVNAKQSVVELTKQNAESFCVVTNNISIVLSPQLEKKTFEYSILEDNTIALTKYWDEGLETLAIPERIDGHTVTRINKNTFGSNNTLKTLTIPDTVEKMEEGSVDCDKLESITTPFIYQNVTKYGLNPSGLLFEYMPIFPEDAAMPTSLKNIKITKDNSIYIGYMSYNNSIEKIEFSENVTSISIKDFRMLKNFKSLVLGNNISKIEIDDFSGSNSGEVSNLGWVKTNTDSNGFLIVPSKDGSTKYLIYVYASSTLEKIESSMLTGVRTIANNAFNNCTSLKSISLPNSVKTMADVGLKNVSIENVEMPSCLLQNNKISDYFSTNSLKTVVLNESTSKSIVDFAFEGCENITKIVLPNNITSIGSAAFKNCTSIENILLPESITEIKDNTFAGCSSLISVNLSDIITSIGASAFEGCKKLSTIKLPKYLTEIKEKTFYCCYSLKINELPNAIETIGESAFFTCKSLAIKSLPENLKNIGRSGFAVCSSITSLVINKKLESIEYRAFDECYGLAEIYNLSNIDIKLGRDIGLYAKVIHKDLNESTKIKIYNGAEYYDDGVSKIFLTMVDRASTSITIESDCIEIVGSAFEFCTNLTSITIPASVKKIGEWAFNGCTSLISVTFENPSGWESNNNSLTLTDSSQNAKYITSTYYSTPWIKS